MNEVVCLVMPCGYGAVRPETAAAFFNLATRRPTATRIGMGSALTRNFNDLWCFALNLQRQGIDVRYFAMQHDDVAPTEQFWLDKLIEELEARQLDVLSAALPIKDWRGLTSCGLAEQDPATHWNPSCRFSMRELQRMPETFTASDIGHPDKVLLVNTGLWVCRFDQPWRERIAFDISNGITFNAERGEWETQFEPEDWHVSRQFHALGLRVAVTRKVKAKHWGPYGFPNDRTWGKEFDTRLTEESLVG